MVLNKKMCYNMKCLKLMEVNMINIEKVKEEFEKYVSKFDSNQGRIKLKIDHIKRVAKISKELAEYLNLNEEQKSLAEAIGIFHDIGRFKQVEMYDTFSDKDSINHAELGVKILFDDNLIENFEIEEKYKRIIKLAILNHNKDKIEDGLSDEENLFCKIIRDADKLDIFYVLCNYDFESAFWYKDFDCREISDTIMKQLKELHRLNYKDIKNNADQIAVPFAYVFDLNFDFSLRYLSKKQYLDEFTELVCKNFKAERVHEQTREMLEYVNRYIDGKNN